MTILQIKVKPHSRESGLQLSSDGTWLARLQSLPIDGKANAELIRLIAERFKVPKTQITIQSGMTSRVKRVRIEGPSRPGSS
jgi:uncharacterized protein (TIGR00251 family)